MNPEERLRQIQHFIARMPSLSTTVAKVLQICNTPSSSANDLNRVISYDPVLTGQMIKLINSAYYGLPNRITSLTRAIVMLGVNTVKNLVLATSVLGGCKDLSSIRQLNINEFWAHSLCVGVLAKLIAKMGRIPAIKQEEYFIAGLLHDLGKLPMMACFPELYAEAVETSNNQNMHIVESESLHIGFNHCHVGILIGAKWKLSPGMLNAINKHHSGEPLSDPLFLISSIVVANYLANQFSAEPADDHLWDMPAFQIHAERTGVSRETLAGLKTQMVHEIDKAKVFLEISE